MKLTNYLIYEYGQQLYGLFNDMTVYIPAKANFYIHKNIKIILTAAEEIENTRLSIAQNYGIFDEKKNQYMIPNEYLQEANAEVNDLFSIEQDLDIKTFKLEDLGNAEFTPKQMQAIMFMIED